MAKLQFKLQEDEEKEITTETPVDETPKVDDTDVEVENTPEETTETIFTEPVSDKLDFIDSDELNEIREILLDIPDDIMLLLLNDNAIILATEENNTTMVYTLEDEADEFTTIELPKVLSDILTNDNIIKYTPDRVDPRHEKVVEILMNKLVDKEVKPKADEPKEEEEAKDE